MSTLVGNILVKAAKTHPKVEGHVIASCLAVIAGCIIVFIGLIRCGWIVDLIPLVSISAFMTGSAINIAAGQVPTLMGISSYFNTRAPTYLVIINTLKNLHHSTLDAAIGLTSLTLLYLIRGACKYAAKKFPSRQKAIFFIATLRTAFVILLYILISWLANRHHQKKPKFKILGTVPRGTLHQKISDDESLTKVAQVSKMLLSQPSTKASSKFLPTTCHQPSLFS
jgi:solute carrier family 26 (sodium-independent sulfate anion transporter), member 11